MIDKLDSFQYSKNLEQHLKEFKTLNNIDNLSEEDKIIKFVEYVDNEEIKYIKNIKKQSQILSSEYIDKVTDIIDSCNFKLTFIEEYDKKSNFFTRLLSPKYKNNVGEKDIVEIKLKKSKDITLSLTLINKHIRNIIINQPKKASVNEIKHYLSNHNKLYTLDSLIKEQPLFIGKLKYLDLKPYNIELKEILTKSIDEFEKFKKDLKLSTYDKINLYASKESYNKFFELSIKSFNHITWKITSSLSSLNPKNIKPVDIFGQFMVAATISMTGNFIYEMSKNIPKEIIELYKDLSSDNLDLGEKGLYLLKNHKDLTDLESYKLIKLKGIDKIQTKLDEMQSKPLESKIITKEPIEIK